MGPGLRRDDIEKNRDLTYCGYPRLPLCRHAKAGIVAATCYAPFRIDRMLLVDL